MVRFATLFTVALVAVSSSITSTAFAPTFPSATRMLLVARRTATPTLLNMVIDYNDPLVAEEFANVQPMSFEDVEDELLAKGIPVPATMK